MKKLFSIITIVAVTATAVLADLSVHPDAGTTAADFLKIPPGGRGSAMGEFQSGILPDTYGMWWNPAYLAGYSEYEAAATYNRWFQGINNSFGAGIVPFERGTGGLMFRSLTVPSDMERRSGEDENDPFFPYTSPEGSFGAYDIMAGFGYGLNLKKDLSAGVSLKGIIQSIDQDKAYGMALDAGVLYRLRALDRDIYLSGVLRNFGPAMRFRKEYYNLPFDINMGAGTKIIEDLSAGINFRYPTDDYPSIHGGAEYSLFENFLLRCGYVYRIKGLPLGGFSGFRGGFGLRMSDWSLDYAFAPYSYLGNTHRISVGMKFGPKKEKKPAEKLSSAQKKRKKVTSETSTGTEKVESKEKSNIEVVPLSITPVGATWSVKYLSDGGFIRRIEHITEQQNVEGIKIQVEEDIRETEDEEEGIVRRINLNISDNMNKRAIIKSTAELYFSEDIWTEETKIYGDNFNELGIMSEEDVEDGKKIKLDITGFRKIFIKQWIKD
ncbi:MAG: PorV/PorQ family protein [Elusimicrobiota bacterium]